jgi:hypothetical protein
MSKKNIHSNHKLERLNILPFKSEYVDDETLAEVAEK